MSIIGPLRFADQYCSSSNGAWRVLCLVFLIYRLNLRERRMIQGASEHEHKTKTTAIASGLCAKTWKGQPYPPSAIVVCAELQNQNKVLSRADGPASWMSYAILSGHRKWNVSASVCLTGFASSSQRWGIQLPSDWMRFINHKGENVGFNFHALGCGFCTRWPR